MMMQIANGHVHSCNVKEFESFILPALIFSLHEAKTLNLHGSCGEKPPSEIGSGKVLRKARRLWELGGG